VRDLPFAGLFTLSFFLLSGGISTQVLDIIPSTGKYGWTKLECLKVEKGLLVCTAGGSGRAFSGTESSGRGK